MHQVLLARLEENFQEGKETLKGIVRLVRKIGEMKVGEGVRDTVLGAVIRLERVQVRILFFSFFLFIQMGSYSPSHSNLPIQPHSRLSSSHGMLLNSPIKHFLILP